MLWAIIPDNAADLCNGRLVINVTKVSRNGIEPHRIESFRDNAHLIDVIKASCHIPIIGGMMPSKISAEGKFELISCYDGGLAERSPKAVSEPCIYVSASGLSHCHIRNSIPSSLTLGVLPPTSLELEQFLELGYLHAQSFLTKSSEFTPKLQSIHSRAASMSQPSEAKLLALEKQVEAISWNRMRILSNLKKFTVFGIVGMFALNFLLR